METPPPLWVEALSHPCTDASSLPQGDVTLLPCINGPSRITCKPLSASLAPKRDAPGPMLSITATKTLSGWKQAKIPKPIAKL